MNPLDQQRPETIVSAFTALARSHPGRLALAIQRESWRFGKRYDEVSAGELERDANTFAAALEHHGIQKGMRTVVMIPPGREFCAAIFALLKLGAPPVLIDPGIGLRNLRFAIQQIRPEAFLGIHKAELARRILGWGRDSIRISLTLESLWGRPMGHHSSVAEGGHAKPAPGDLAAIAFTSGSTGSPKGVAFDHGNLCAQADLLKELLGPRAEGPHLVTFPLLLIFAPVLGVTAVLPRMDPSRPSAASPKRLMTASNDYGCRSAFISPALVRKLAAYCRDTASRFSTMERIFSAGAPTDPDVLATFEPWIAPGGEIFTPYGATEALAVSNIGSREILTQTRQETRRGAGVCVGRPLRGIAAAIIPISDQAIQDWGTVPVLAPGEIGEITVSGRVVSREYFNDSEATKRAKIRRSGVNSGPDSFWHRMGDLGYFDDVGRLWMCGRKSHRVVTAARIYFTVSAEGVFNGHPEVSRTALVGIDGAKTVPVLCVELAARKSAGAKRRITKELRALGASCEQTREIRHFLYHGRFPVDIRHNAKIRREELAVWAAKKMGIRKPKAEERTT